VIGFSWFIDGIRAMCAEAEFKQNNRAALQMAREQADYAEASGDTACADFWRAVEDGLVNESQHPDLRG
jgi:hypothetical protein